MTTESITSATHNFDKCCPDCGCMSIMTDFNRGEKVCQNCGLVIDESIMDERAEPDYGDERSKERAHYGMPVDNNFRLSGLSTEISGSNRDANGNLIPLATRQKFRVLRKLQHRTRVQNGVERNLLAAKGEIDRLTAAMKLPQSVHDMTVTIYRSAIKKNLVKGRSIDGIVAGSVYAACRKHSVPRTVNEISAHSRIKKKELGRIVRMMTRALRLRLNVTNPKEYVARFCSELGLSNDTEFKAKDILEQTEHLGLSSGRSPTGLAAAAIYLATEICGERRTKRSISDVANVTEVTIRQRYKELVSGLGIGPVA